MSWKIRIIGLYTIFVVLILGMVVFCYGQKIELDSPDYYIQELKYQQRIDATRNALAMGKTIEHQVLDHKIELRLVESFLDKELKGEVYFFRPSDAGKDKKLAMQFSTDGLQVIDTGEFDKGVYKMQLSWTVGDKNYYKESVIYIQP